MSPSFSMPALKPSPSTVQRQGVVDWKHPPIEHLERQIEPLEEVGVLAKEHNQGKTFGAEFQKLQTALWTKMNLLKNLRETKCLVLEKRIQQLKSELALEDLTIEAKLAKQIELKKLEQEYLDLLDLLTRP